jgi:glycosyltransferase involved in cell wall biosynthesis
MRILYVATDQIVPGTTGGSTHVTAVAHGLAALGHEVHALATPAATGSPQLTDRVRWHALGPPLGVRQLRFLRAPSVARYLRAIRPHVLIERYYNFGGEGVFAAHAAGVPVVLEVNAPIVDYAGSPKGRLDRALLLEPMRRWREWQCRTARLIVTPRATILPLTVPRASVLELEWGADTERFRPDPPGQAPFARGTGETLAVFAGAFRPWHGAIHLVDAIHRLRARGRTDITAAFVGDGPELPRVREAAAGLSGIVFLGAVDHERMPACLGAADIGVAPFDVRAHAPLGLDFYWSPLKIFEYMATGLPVVAPAIPRLGQIVAHEREGILYDPSNPDGLAMALERLADDAARRRALGAAARIRAVREYGWDVHCRKLDEALRAICPIAT